jgi:hypothetical protein
VRTRKKKERIQGGEKTKEREKKTEKVMDMKA